MEFFNSTDLASKASTVLAANQRRSYSSIYESADTIMAKEASESFSNKTFDIFLSHSFLDANIIYGLKNTLGENHISVYVYWIEDSSERSKVTAATAERIKMRMQSCRALLYATSDNAEHSKWMPWELGYFDGIRGKVAICPITE